MINITFKFSHCCWCPVPGSHIRLFLINKDKKGEIQASLFPPWCPRLRGRERAGEQCGMEGGRQEKRPEGGEW